MGYGSVNVPGVAGVEAAAAKTHVANKSNPHGVTAAQVGLGNVPNVATNDQTPTFTAASTLAAPASGEKMSTIMGKLSKAAADLIAHLANKSNPHGVTAAQIGAAAASHSHNYAAASHNHSADQITSGVLAIARGGLGNDSGYVRAGQKAGTTIGNCATVEGFQTIAWGDYSHAEGFRTFCDCLYGGHAEGDGTIAASTYCYIAIESYSGKVLSVNSDEIPGGWVNISPKITSGMKIYIWNDYYSNAQIFEHEIANVDTSAKTITLTENLPTSSFYATRAVIPAIRDTRQAYWTAHAEGCKTAAIGADSHAEGYGTIARGTESHTEGSRTKAYSNYTHAEGYGTIAKSQGAHAEGYGTTASGEFSHAEGHSTTARGRSSHAGGEGTIAAKDYQTVIGRNNVESTSESDLFIVGKGKYNYSSQAVVRSNCFRVNETGVFATGNYSSTGADYAELFEWADGNPDAEDRVGLFVTLDGEKIRLARPEDDYILGILSGNPSVLGDVHDDQWQGMYLYDIYGRPLWEDVEVPDETIEEPDPEDPEKTITRVVIPAHTEHRQQLNPDYDGSQPYIPRTQRPEWGTVGMLGKLVALDDGTCQVNGYCTSGEGGIATASKTRTHYRVMARLDDTHVKVMVM